MYAFAIFTASGFARSGFASPLDSAPAAAAAAPAGYDSDGSERGGDDDLNDASEVPAAIGAELMGWDTYDDGYVGS